MGERQPNKALSPVPGIAAVQSTFASDGVPMAAVSNAPFSSRILTPGQLTWDEPASMLCSRHCGSGIPIPNVGVTSLAAQLQACVNAMTSLIALT